ncbi:MAG: DNA polymerase III subunit chi [Alphaproteobacteria bacterium]|nr:DNA polymerase III subunit chi [Alphaproteobacteria bacterium]
MTEIRFYHLTRRSLEEVLPVMLERTVVRDGRRAVVIAGSPDRVENLNAHLWTYNDRVFLPHGSKADGHAALQPVWLTDSDENPNDAQVLFLSDGATSGDIAGFELVCELFDGRDDAAVSAARERWRVYKEDGHDLTYWQQTERGGWEQKAGG